MAGYFTDHAHPPPNPLNSRSKVDGEVHYALQPNLEMNHYSTWPWPCGHMGAVNFLIYLGEGYMYGENVQNHQEVIVVYNSPARRPNPAQAKSPLRCA